MSIDADGGRFADRIDAGRRLASELRDRGNEADIVLAIPRGGVPVGRPVADALDVPLDVVVASKIGAPDNPEYAIGAVASDGSAWFDEGSIDRLGVSDVYVDRGRNREAAAAREKASRYRNDGPVPNLSGRSVVVVDDGAATGATAIAALRLVAAAGAERIVLALPVAPPDTIDRLEDHADVDTVVALETPTQFRAVGAFYDRFDQVSDEEAMALLSDPDD
ncbi:phosphoribosyltransferase [Haloplanus pelagicus]|jgi:predicted phosphoribosyltransferase|uniref:phosphoribosyltransferase n=1 Tax=Haloplanus pelagicus TaxID=2949995 RepID=UPI0020419F88|nr:phosphoribosyltransferase family protein [Haloplanus sp. HW8-1]